MRSIGSGWFVGFASGNEIYEYVDWLPIFFVCVDSKLKI